jgi:hypothetical protein
MVALYLHSPTCLHGTVLNYIISAGITLPYLRREYWKKTNDYFTDRKKNEIVECLIVVKA